MIDHHETPESFSNLFLSKPEIGSTCEIIYNVMKLINNKQSIRKLQHIFILGF